MYIYSTRAYFALLRNSELHHVYCCEFAVRRAVLIRCKVAEVDGYMELILCFRVKRRLAITTTK